MSSRQAILIEEYIKRHIDKQVKYKEASNAILIYNGTVRRDFPTVPLSQYITDINA